MNPDPADQSHHKSGSRIQQDPAGFAQSRTTTLVVIAGDIGSLVSFLIELRRLVGGNLDACQDDPEFE
jgi:hypothetical protein